MERGRPTKYHKVKTPKEVAKYVSLCATKHYLPTIEGLAVHLGVWRSTLHDWADPKNDAYQPDFHDIFENLRAAQASALIQNGLKGEYNSTITKLMLTKHGYTDKQDITSDGKPVPILGNVLSDDSPQEDSETS